MPICFLLSKGRSEPIPTMLAFHGYDVKDMIARREDGGDGELADDYYEST